MMIIKFLECVSGLQSWPRLHGPHPYKLVGQEESLQILFLGILLWDSLHLCQSDPLHQISVNPSETLRTSQVKA